jgi:hypothetical protein
MERTAVMFAVMWGEEAACVDVHAEEEAAAA